MKALCNRYKDNPNVQCIGIDDGIGNDEMYHISDDVIGRDGIEHTCKRYVF